MFRSNWDLGAKKYSTSKCCNFFVRTSYVLRFREISCQDLIRSFPVSFFVDFESAQPHNFVKYEEDRDGDYLWDRILELDYCFARVKH